MKLPMEPTASERDTDAMVRQAGLEALKFVGRLLLGAASAFLFVYLFSRLFEDVVEMVVYSAANALEGIEYFSTK